VRLNEDPADWLLKHSPDEFREMLAGSVTLLEYLFRRKTEKARGGGAAERSRMMSEIQDLIRRIEDPVFYRDALRIAAEALGVSPAELESGRKERVAPSTRSSSTVTQKTPLEQAGREVLAMLVAHPDLCARALEEGVVVSPRLGPLLLRPEDFADEDQGALFRLLRDHPGEDLEAVLSDEQARGHMDRLVALGAEAEEMRRNGIHSSAASVRELWLRLSILSREREKRATDDYDRKESLQAEIMPLREALRSISAAP
jgi:DNA primase